MAYEKLRSDHNDVTCLMLATMIPELQKQFMDKEAFEIMVSLKEMFQTHARHERFVITKQLISCKMSEGTQVGSHVLKMRGHLDALEKLEVRISNELATDLILGSLPSSFNTFVRNYYMQGMDKSIAELHGMLKTAEENVQKTSPALMVQKAIKKGKKKGKGKKSRPKANLTPRKDETSVKTSEVTTPEKDAVCYHCQKTGRWRRNCKSYLEVIKKKGKIRFRLL